MDVERCSALATMGDELPGVDIESVIFIASVEDMSSKDKLTDSQKAAFKPFCKVSGYFEKRTGAQNKPYAIGFGLSLPLDWQGRLLFQGGGALNGLIREPVGTRAAGDIPAIFRGFAVASTDSGHQSDSIFNTDFFADQQALLNFYSGAVEKTTALVKSLLTDIYQQAPEHSYFVGCSTGGREAMTMSQRFPRLFDGIIAGAPARQTNRSEIADLWSAKRLRQVSDSGNEPPFSPTQRQAIVSELVRQCDALDGMNDGLIFATDQCNFDTTALRCSDNTNANACLTEPQIQSLEEAFDGPKTADGEQVYPGFYFDTGIDDEPEKAGPGLLLAQPGPLGRARIDLPFDIERELAIANGFPLEPGNAVLTNMSTFAHEGHKLMFFHGVSDPWFSAKDTLGYFQDMMAANGGESEVSQWSQLYLVPGMGHCHGGDNTLDQFDMLSALVDWVEASEQPESVIAFGEAMPGVERPLCPFPSFAVYSGKGNEAEAGSYRCEIPDAL
tara:strand:- start:2583 stop:4082 length:1500 start_codon:yes stop_codon:yes gene_type:complete